MNFQLTDGTIPLMLVISDTKKEAWELVHKAGIRNKSTSLDLVEDSMFVEA